MKMRFWVAIAAVFAAATAILSPSAFALESGEARKTLLQTSGKGKLFRLTPPGGGEQASLPMLELRGRPYDIGRQHGELLARGIADVIGNLYCDSVFTPEVLAWVEGAYYKMPRERQDEIRGIADGLSRKGYRIPFSKVILHATQVPVYGIQFPWFLCPWEKGSGPTGSFSYAVWGRYTHTGTALAINSPDFGEVPKSLARNRVLISVRPKRGFRHAYLGVAGVIGFSGANETGLSTAGTSGPVSAAGLVTPEVGKPVPDGFMPILLLARHILQYLDAGDPQVLERYEDLLRENPIEGIHAHLTLRDGRSVVWESGAARSPDYPRIARRTAGEWDNGTIMPVDWRGDFVLLPSGVLRSSALPFPVVVDFYDGNGEPSSGRSWPDGVQVHWRREQLGRAFNLPVDKNRGGQFQDWFLNLGILPVDAPVAITDDARWPDSIVSVLPDRTGGWWVTADGLYFGSWMRDGSGAFRSFLADGTHLCSGPLYDFGNGVAGWCRVGETDIEWVAWTHQYPDGAPERLDASNFSTLPGVKPLAQAGHPLYGGGHARTHFFLRELGAPRGRIGLDELYGIFQRAYFAVGQEDQPFGVSAYDLSAGDALFTVSRYENGTYIGGLAVEQKPIRLSRYQLFGR